MARHADDDRKRGIAGWLIGSAVLGVLLVAAVTGYFVFVNSDSGSGAVDTGCTGASTVVVVADTAAPVVTEVADAYNGTRPAARGTCVSIKVVTLDSATAATALVGDWANQALPQPALWIADAAADVAAVQAGAPELVAGHSDAVLATSPVVLAMSAADADRVAGALAWKDLATATDPDSGIQLAGDRRLTLALGDPRTDLGTAFAVESMLGTGSAVQIEQVTAGSAAIGRLSRESARSANPRDLLDDLARGASAFSAVPVLEVDVAGFDQAAGADQLRAVYPTGPTVGAELLPITLTADWVDRVQTDAATTFLAHLRSSVGLTALQDAGFRVPDVAARSSADGIDPSAPLTTQPAAGSAVREAIAQAMGLSATPAPQVTSSAPATSTSTSAATAGQPDATGAATSPSSG